MRGPAKGYWFPSAALAAALAFAVAGCSRSEPSDSGAHGASEPAPSTAAHQAPAESLSSLEPAAGSARDAPAETGAAPGIYRVGGEVQAPIAIYKVGPDYSKIDLRGRRASGMPVIAAIINEKGEVEDVHVVKPSIPEVDAAIVDAMKQWRFKPATLHGKPVRVRYMVSVTIDWR
jgi:TonB family protein